MLNSLRSYLENPSERNGTSSIRGALGSFVRAVAASVTLGTGNSLGPEGPSVEIGSSIAKGVSNVFKWNGGKSLSIVAAGSAAGISSGHILIPVFCLVFFYGKLILNIAAFFVKSDDCVFILYRRSMTLYM